jgi:hypothetical protein
MAGTDDDERTVADRVKATVLELPASSAANDDDEDTTKVDDPARAQLRPTGEVDTGKPTQQEMPKAVASIEADAGKPTQAELPVVPTARAFVVPDDSDDDPTQARPPPVMKSRPPEPKPEKAPAPGLLARGRKVEVTDEYKPRRIHPLVPLGVLLAALLALLLAVNWLRKSAAPEGEDAAPGGIHTLFSW